MATYAITGANRGLGLALIQQLLLSPTHEIAQIYSISRSPPSGAYLSLITSHPSRLIPIVAAITSDASIQNAAAEIETRLQGKGLDVLINNAGVGPWHPDGVRSVSADDLARTFDVNVAGPQRCMVAFLPLLEKGGGRKVVNVSTALASISWADRWPNVPTSAYKVSKTALNMLNKHWAMEYADKGFTFLLLSPGHLKTDLGGGDFGELEVEVGAKEVKRIILEADTEMNV
ncbi:hypothetical protein MBLNU457_g0719t2 [Dothideomycetes sp. NU457]